MLEIVTSANVACGFHAGDPSTLRRTCTIAAANGVTIGAQVSYPDLPGFGRREMVIAPDELHDVVLYQLGALDAFAPAAGSRVAYVKPHGALYHVAARDEATAGAIVDAVRTFGADLHVLGLSGSRLLRAAADAGVTARAEAFADRAYTADGGLAPRSEPGSVLTDPGAIAARAVEMVRSGRVVAVDGTTVRVEVASLCVHGDTSGAVQIATRVRAALEAAGIAIEPFSRR